MHTGRGRNKTLTLLLTVTLAAVSASMALLAYFSPVQPAAPDPVAATYSHGELHVSVASPGIQADSGNLGLEVLDPEDRIVGRFDQRVYDSGKQGIWNQDVPLVKTLALEDLVWYRLRYRFIYDGQSRAALDGVRSISAILRHPVVHVVAQHSYLSGAPAAVRVIVTDSNNRPIPGQNSVQIRLVGQQAPPRTLFAGKLNERGTTQAQFHFPAGLAGSYSLRYVVATAIGAAEYSQDIQLDDKVAILLSTEKPVYQPNQTIHARALALDRSNRQAAASRNLTFELEDSRGNKVFRRIARTDSFGIASAEFQLADEVNFGAYHLRALMDEVPGAPRNTAEMTLQVDRYVLPKFKVAVDLAADDAAAHRGYRPGDHVRGTVRANYFFGKPVDSAPIIVKASSMDVSVFEAATSQGRTDNDGVFHFDIRLPGYFAGHPLSQGAARVLIEATVKDGAGHSETRGEPITVSESALLITAVPESGSLIPGLENDVFILTSYPDGTPAQTDVTVRVPGNADQTAISDAGGVALVRLRPAQGAMTLKVDAKDHAGSRASNSLTLQSHTGSDQILLRSDRAVYGSGDRIDLHVFSTRQRGGAYVDVIKDGQTVATRDLDLVSGRADLALAATPELAGTVEFNAYLFGEDARAVADRRLVFVEPADELKIETSLDAPAYKPGSEARIGFRVTNSHGEGVQAALGLQIVDQAVFALAEKRPGFAKVFFYLEQEAMKPRYEIHSIGLPETISPVQPLAASQRDRAARALFSATQLVASNNTETEFGRAVPQQNYSVYLARYRDALSARLDRLTAVLAPDAAVPTETCNQERIAERVQRADPAGLLDAWGNKLRIEAGGWNRGIRTPIEVRSAGPDGQFNTSDDLVQPLETPGCVWPWQRVGIINLQVEHDRGPFNGLAEVVGKVSDVTGRSIAGASVKLIEIGARAERKLAAGADGRFSFAGVRGGLYEIQISSPGFAAAARQLSLNARDRAMIAATLNVGTTTETVEVMAMAQAPMAMLAMNGRAAQPIALVARKEAALPMDRNDLITKDSGGAVRETHVRSWFPEALYVTPEILTDQQGRASIVIPIADNITTWRMAMLASTAQGALGSATSSLKVFQDFFVDLDLPVTLTLGDQVSIPVAIYNYEGSRGDVHLRLQQEDWFSSTDTLEKTEAVESGRVGTAQFTIAANRIGKFKLTLNARMDDAAKRADIVVREIEVIPNGREQSMAFNGRLDSSVRHQLEFPAASIPDASTIFVRLYPGPLSQVIEGMDSLLRMPYGCFEQTSSTTYPNVLALDYMKRTKKATPEVRAKAAGFIATGYQRLLTFEVPGGGFSWFGNAPANKILTSYGLMEFGDMSKIYDIDSRVIERTQQWLAGQQQADGRWNPDVSFINEGATNRYNSDALRITAYIAWALETTGYRGSAVDKAKQFIETHLNTVGSDPYTLALVANFAVDYGKDRAFASRAVQLLLDARTEQGDKAWWKADETGVYSTGASAIVETTGLAAQALLKSGASSAVVARAIDYIASRKDASGAWGTTQATVMALRAMLLSTEMGSATAKGAVEVLLNGKVAANLTLTAENNDLLHQFSFKQTAAQSPNLVEIRFKGEGSLAYQVAGRYFLPWTEKPANEPLSIAVSYDRTSLAQDDLVTATASVRNNLSKAANMVMVDLGIPPGFELLAEDLEAYRDKTTNQKSGRLEKFNLTATQAILYFDSIAPNNGFKLSFRLRAKYPIRARTFASRVYEYYTPEVGSLARPVQLEVRKR